MTLRRGGRDFEQRSGRNFYEASEIRARRAWTSFRDIG